MLLGSISEHSQAVQVWSPSSPLRALTLKYWKTTGTITNLLLFGAHDIGLPKQNLTIHLKSGVGDFYAQAEIIEDKSTNELFLKVEQFYRLAADGEKLMVYPHYEMNLYLYLPGQISSNLLFLNKTVEKELRLFSQFLKNIKNKLIPEKNNHDWKSFRLHFLSSQEAIFVCTAKEKEFIDKYDQFSHAYILLDDKKVKLSALKIIDFHGYQDPRMEAVPLFQVRMAYTQSPSLAQWCEQLSSMIKQKRFTPEKEQEFFMIFQQFVLNNGPSRSSS
ncbi:MAG: hypothetical protein WCG27_06060 [Pseudomonadota bacterium]